MRRLILTGAAILALAGLAAPASAQDDGSSSSTSSTSTSTTAPLPSTPDTTTTTSPTEDTTTTTSAEDPVGHVDAPPDTVPLSPETVPPPPGQPVDALAAQRLLRRELKVAQADALQSEEAVAQAAQLVDDLSDRLAEGQRNLAHLGAAQELAVSRLEAARERFEDRVANAVVRGNAAELDTIISSADANEVLTRRTFLQSVTEADSESVVEYRQAKDLVDDAVLRALDDVDATRQELRDARKRLEEELSLNAEKRFQLAVFSAGSEIVIDGFVFPVGEPYSFVDSWGFPRMMGTEYQHGHQGTDIMAPFGTPLYACERGVIIRVGEDVLGGTKLWLKGQSGTYYYYAHLQAYAEGIGEGTVVEAGDVVGFVGDTGNARGGAPHLHFQIHPGGGDAVNPYGLLKVVSDLQRR